jgi:hypothetical protein
LGGTVTGSVTAGLTFAGDPGHNLLGAQILDQPARLARPTSGPHHLSISATSAPVSARLNS